MMANEGQVLFRMLAVFCVIVTVLLGNSAAFPSAVPDSRKGRGRRPKIKTRGIATIVRGNPLEVRRHEGRHLGCGKGKSKGKKCTTETPIADLTLLPTVEPSAIPSLTPSTVPSSNPTSVPSSPPTTFPTFTPTERPSPSPSRTPTMQPTSAPSSVQGVNPPLTPEPSLLPKPPTTQPTNSPTSTPSPPPSPSPTTSDPTTEPTPIPTPQPTPNPTVIPTPPPSLDPTPPPTLNPTPPPTHKPTPLPTANPTPPPTESPSPSPTPNPTPPPPTPNPTMSPSLKPTNSPTPIPTPQPTLFSTISPSTAPSFVPSISERPSTSLTPSASTMPSVPPSVSAAPTTAVFATEQLGDVLVSTCIKDPTESVTASFRTLEFQYVMMLTPESNANTVGSDVQNNLQKIMASRFLKCEFERRLRVYRRVQDDATGIDFIALSTDSSETTVSNPLPLVNCPVATSAEGSCFVVNDKFTVSYLGETRPDSDLVDKFDPFLSEEMASGGRLETSNANITGLEFLGFTNANTDTGSGSASGIVDGNVSQNDGDGGDAVLPAALIAGASVGLVLVGFLVIRKRDSISGYFKHSGEEESIDRSDDQEISLPSNSISSRDLMVDNQETSSTSSPQWNFSVSETTSIGEAKEEFEIEYKSDSEVPIVEAMLLSGEELDDFVKSMRPNMSDRRYLTADTVDL